MELSNGSDTATVWVSTDSPRVVTGSDRIREAAGAEAAQTIADLMGARMITPALYERRHAAASVVIDPAVASLVKSDGNIGNTTARDASEYMDRMIQESSRVKAADWIVSCVGKGFVIANEITITESTDAKGASNFGWIVHVDDTYQSGGKTWWRGIVVYPCLVIPDHYYIQRHTDLGHGLYQDDYASQPLFVRCDARANGAPCPLDRLLTDPKLCALVTHDGVPLKWVRHPGVPLTIEIDTLPPGDSAPPAPDTDPSPPRWLDPDLSHGERKVSWLFEQRDLNVREQPDGSNNGPEISTYHAATRRDGKPGFGKWLAKAGGNWCASSASAAALRTRVDGDPGPLMIQRSSGIEIEGDAKKAGTWRPSELAIADSASRFVPEIGDLATTQRGTPGSWRRHVVIVIRDLPDLKSVLTIGGNEGNRFGQDTVRKYSSLLGFVEMADDAGVRFDGAIPAQEGGETDPGHPDEDGDNALAWAPMTPDVWTPQQWRGVEGSDRRWKTTLAGISVQGESGPRRTKGKPITAGKVWTLYQSHIREASDLTGVPIATLIAMIATESGTDPEAERFEKRLKDWSFGCAQTITSTAFEMAKSLPITSPSKPVPRGGSVSAWRSFLFDSRNSILCGARYIAYNDERWNLLSDPVLAYASYNAGSPRVRDTPWGLSYFRGGQYDALDVFAAWYGDSRAVLGS